MASSLKVGSAWKSITGLSVKVGGSWKTASAAYTKIGGVWKQWYAPVVLDDFNRSTSGALGTTTSGASWSNLRSYWYANGSAGQTDTAGSSYPIATVGFGNVKFLASLGVTNGTGLAFWIQDADNWYAAYAFQTTTSTQVVTGSYSCGACQQYGTPYTPSAGTYPNCNCGVASNGTSATYGCQQTCGGGQTCTSYGPIKRTSYDCDPGYTTATGVAVPSDCPNGGSVAYSPFAYCYKYVPNPTSTATSCNGGICCCGGSVVGSPTEISPGTPGSCSACSEVTPCLSYPTCYTYGTSTTNTWVLRLIKMTAGAITIPVTDVSLSATPAALRVSTESGNIEVFAYSDAAMTNQMGSTLTYTPATQGPGQYLGVIKAPSDSQGSTVDNLLITL